MDVPSKTGIFAQLIAMRERKTLTSVIEILKKKLGVTTHFSEIITTNLIDTGPLKKTPVSISRFASINHALVIWFNRNAALIFKKYGGHCVACLVDMIVSYSSS